MIGKDFFLQKNCQNLPITKCRPERHFVKSMVGKTICKIRRKNDPHRQLANKQSRMTICQYEEKITRNDNCLAYHGWPEQAIIAILAHGVGSPPLNGHFFSKKMMDSVAIDPLTIQFTKQYLKPFLIQYIISHNVPQLL